CARSSSPTATACCLYWRIGRRYRLADPLAIYGAITGTVGALGVIWRIGEWYLNNRLVVQVTGSAGKAEPNEMGQPELKKGERFGYEHIVVEVLNRSRRPIMLHA